MNHSHFLSLFSQNFSTHIGNMILRELRKLMTKVRRLRKWYLVDKLTRAFAEAYLLMRLKTIKSIILMKAIIETIKKLKELISEEARLIKIGLSEAWKISELASKWGHPSSTNWKNNKYFIIHQALTLKWLSRLIGGIMLR